MAKVAVVLFADTETHGDMARAANALELASELQEAGDEAAVVFDGAATKWVPELAKSDHPLHGLFESVRDTVTGACRHCAVAFGAREGVQAAGVPLLGEHHGHPSLRTFVAQGYEVITF